MLAAVTLHDLRLYIPLTALTLIGICALRFRTRVTRVFGTDEPDIAALEPVWRKLEAINEECRTHAFGAKRLATVSLAGRTVTLIYGLVSVDSMRGGVSNRVYALAEGDQAAWMRRFPDVFELAFSGSTSSVFWVKLSALIRLSRQNSPNAFGADRELR